jgi:hypothetical protein
VIANIGSTVIRRMLVVLTVIALLAIIPPLWLIATIWELIEKEFGEDISSAWRGAAK